MKPLFSESRIIQLWVVDESKQITVVQKVYVDQIGRLLIKYKGKWFAVSYEAGHGWSANVHNPGFEDY
jgi:hypothetical protein